MMSNKNPFEIRLEVLKMAKDMSEQSYQMSIDTYWQTLNATAEAWNKSVEELLHEKGSRVVYFYFN
jgi:hypothetical protein